MGDDESLLLEKQHALILKKIATAEGAFKATGYLGGALICVVCGIAIYAFNKIEAHSKMIAENTRDIAVTSSKLVEYDRWRQGVDNKLERVIYNK